MNRCIDKITFYFPHDCINKTGTDLTISKVESYRENRLSRTYGNINFTDYWFASLDDFINQDISYTCQQVMLLSDMEGCSEWLNKELKKDEYVCLAFVKIMEDKDTAKRKLSECGDRAKCFYTLGNADYIYVYIARDEEEVRQIGEKLISQREDYLFSLYMLYGKCEKKEIQSGQKEDASSGTVTPVTETFQIQNFQILPENGCKKHEMYEEGKCISLIKDLRDRMKLDKAEKNKKMLSYYQALMQILTVVSQYEQKDLYKDLFFIFYPPIQLFWEQFILSEKYIETLNDKIHNQKETGESKDEILKKKYRAQQELELSFGEFVDAMEVLMHHMGQSCRDILGDSGRGGLPYDVPMRLCLMYIAYLNVLTGLLNDDHDTQYKYCFVPLAYSRPTTNYMGFGLQPGNRLIRVQISRPTMFMPRSLLIILGHEVSHYIGHLTRKREMRARQFFMITAYAVSRSLTSDYLLKDLQTQKDDKNYAFLQEILSYIRSNILKSLIECFQTEWDKRKKADEGREEAYIYYLKNLLKETDLIMRDILQVSNEDLMNAIGKLDFKMIQKLRAADWKLIEDIDTIQEKLRIEVGIIWDSKNLKLFWEAMAENLKEIYADISAILVLELSPKDYLEAFLISECCIPDNEGISVSLVNRIAIVKHIMEKGNHEQWTDWQSEGAQCQSNENVLTWGGKNSVENLMNSADTYLKAVLQNSSESTKGIGTYNLQRGTTQETAVSSDNNTERDFFYCRQIIQWEVEYLWECYVSLKEHLKEAAKKNDYQSLLKRLYRQFALYRAGEDQSFSDFFQAYDELISCYKDNIKKELEKKP